MAFEFLRRLAQGDEEPGGGVFGFLEEKTRPLIKADKAILEFGKDIARMFPRGGASIGATIGEYTNPLLGLPKVSSFETDQFGGLGKAVLGERPIESGQKRRAGIQEVLEGSRMRDYAGPLSFLGAGAAIGLEVTPFGKGKKGIEGLIKASTPQEVKKIVKGISDEGARAISITKDRHAIENILKKQAPTTPPDILPPKVSAGQEVEISEKLFSSLPKTIRQKIQLNQPLAPEELTRLNQGSAKLGGAVNQLNLPIDNIQPVKVKVVTDVAKRTTPSGQTKSIIRGEQVINQNLAKIVKELSSGEPGRFSQMVSSSTGRSSKEFRSMINIINTIRKGNTKAADELEDFLFRPILELDAQANQLVRGLKSQVKNVEKDFGKLSSNDSNILREILDGKLATAAKADNPQAVEAYMNSMRQVYDDALKLVNEQRRQAGVDLIPRREDYFPHMKELLENDFFTRPLTSSDPDYIRRVGSSFGFAKERTGKLRQIEKDPFKVMDVYLGASERQIATAVPSARINGVLKVLDDIGARTDNDVAGWTKWLRRINDDITGSASVDNLVLRLQGRYAAGTIILNPGSTLKNFIQPVLTAGVTRQHALSSLGTTTMANLRLLKNKNIKEYLTIDGLESPYLESAFSAMDLSRLADKSIFQKIGDQFAKTFYATQLSGQRFIVEAFYRQNLAKGLSKKEALKVAERQTETMLPARTPGTLPAVTRGGTLSRAASLFQTEVIAQTEAMIQATTKGVFSASKKETAANIAGLALAGSVFNEGYEELFPGQRPAPDPIKWTINAIDKAKEKDNSGEAMAAGALEFSKSALGQLPFVGSYFTENSRSPLNIPIYDTAKKVGTDISKLFTGEGSEFNAVRLGRNLSPLVGRGGKTIYRAGEGAIRYAQGGQPGQKGEQAFEIPQTPGNLVRAVIGGPYNVKEAQAHFERNKNLTGSQTEFVEKLEKQGASKAQIKATESFFQNLKAGAAGKDDALREFDEAYLAGDEAEARRIATEYNEKLDEQILKWKDKYGEQYATKALRKAYRSRRINATERFKTVKRREKQESKPLQLVP